MRFKRTFFAIRLRRLNFVVDPKRSLVFLGLMLGRSIHAYGLLFGFLLLGVECAFDPAALWMCMVSFIMAAAILVYEHVVLHA